MHHQRRTEERDADPEPEREPAAPDQPEREDRPEHSTRSDSCGQDADARISRAQEVDGDHDREDGQAAARERLHDAERRDQRKPAIGRDGREPLQHLVTAAAHGGRARRGVIRQPDHDQAADQ